MKFNVYVDFYCIRNTIWQKCIYWLSKHKFKVDNPPTHTNLRFEAVCDCPSLTSHKCGAENISEVCIYTSPKGFHLVDNAAYVRKYGEPMESMYAGSNSDGTP